MNSTLKQRLNNQETLLGTLSSLPSPEVTEIMAQAGFDWLFIDMEHGPFEVLMAQRMMMAAGDCPCLVRVPGHSEVHIKKALDAGAAGLIIPQVSSAEQAEKVIGFAKYPPLGNRGVGGGRAQGYGSNLATYVEEANEQLLMVLQVEHIDGVNHIDEILEVDGIDVIFIGPYDLSASLGLTGQVGHPKVLEAIARVEAKCKAKGMPMGYFDVSPEGVLPYREKGYQLLTCGVDTGFLTGQARGVVEALKR